MRVRSRKKRILNRFTSFGADPNLLGEGKNFIIKKRRLFIPLPYILSDVATLLYRHRDFLNKLTLLLFKEELEVVARSCWSNDPYESHVLFEWLLVTTPTTAELFGADPDLSGEGKNLIIKRRRLFIPLRYILSDVATLLYRHRDFLNKLTLLLFKEELEVVACSCRSNDPYESHVLFAWLLVTTPTTAESLESWVVRKNEY